MPAGTRSSCIPGTGGWNLRSSQAAAHSQDCLAARALPGSIKHAFRTGQHARRTRRSGAQSAPDIAQRTRRATGGYQDASLFLCILRLPFPMLAVNAPQFPKKIAWQMPLSTAVGGLIQSAAPAYGPNNRRRRCH
eukprot:2687795-Rhodomonas_salina.4